MLASQQQIRLYNTLSRSVEDFVPIHPPNVLLYCCGPTVYNYQHIGNLRTYIFEDLLARTLRYAGYSVKHVMNITDVGHLVSNADEGEDKMLLASKREGRSSHEIAEFYTQIFFDHCALINVKRPDVVCKATEHIQQMLELIARLEERGYAYTAGGNVYFNVPKFPDYGKLAKLDLENLKAGARIEVDSNKKHPLDFALWFTKSKFENQELQWDSPWGRGYPGWHIECSAMSMHHLGEEIDIHCGGIDHIPVHHTNEIAQSEGASGRPFARVWMHGGFLLTEKDKMSKSAGTFLTLDRIVERGIDPIAYRLFCLAGDYRRELSWSWEGIEGAQNSLNRIKSAVVSWRAEAEAAVTANNPAVSELKRAFMTAISNDLGMAKALSVLHDTIAEKSLTPIEKLQIVEDFDRVLGLGIESWHPIAIETPAAAIRFGEQREAARAAKNWAEADRLRGEIAALGFIVEDSKSGFVLKPKG